MNAKQIEKKMKSLRWEVDCVDKRVDFLTTKLHIAKLDLRRQRGQVEEDRLESEKVVYELSTRARRGLIDCGVEMVCDIELITPAHLVAAWSLGKKTIDEITAWMKKHNLQFKNGNHG